MDGSRNHGRIQAFAIKGFSPRLVPVDRRAFGRPALSDDRCDLTFIAGTNRDESLTAEAVEILFDHTACKQCSDSSVKRIAALRQDFKGGGCCEWMPCRNGAVTSHDWGAFSCMIHLHEDQET